ncbi:MAG TPA: enoyl-CoA hydratase-related protein [Candidatus Dormibacteraeota bacterium]
MPLHVERAGPVVTLRLDDPERRNALDPVLAAAIRAAVASVGEDRGARCVVITGTGASFCSGADLGAVRQAASGVLARRELLQSYYRAFLDLRDLDLPVIAAVNGPAIGAGLNLALCADIRIAGRSARFGATFVRLGIHAGGGATAMLSRLVGPGHAAELLLSGEIIDAARALEIGLVERLVDDSRLAAEAAALGASIATGAPAVMRMTKRTLRHAQAADFAAVLELESLAQAASQDAPEAVEGWAAFREKRPPNFADA